jgi:putative nucleotidyltransferase with HDIG domain
MAVSARTLRQHGVLLPVSVNTKSTAVLRQDATPSSAPVHPPAALPTPARGKGAPPSPQLILYVGTVIVLGAVAVGVSIVDLAFTPHPLQWLAFAALGIVAGTAALKIPGVNALISVSDTFFMASAMLFGPAPAMVALALDSAALAWRRGYNLQRLLFNATAPTISLFAATHVFFWITGAPPLVNGTTWVNGALPALTCMAVVYFGLNSGLTAVAIALESRTDVLDVWRKLTPLAVNYAAATSSAFCLVVMLRFGGLSATPIVLPLVLVFHLTLRSFLGRLDDAQKHMEVMDRLYLRTVETLATAIEAKDGVTHDHIRRVQNGSIGMARILGVTDELTLKAIQAAALLHDTGKIAIPEHILNKPGKLTTVEFEQMKLHVDVGVQMLAAIDYPYPVVPIVAAHHENWDGSGYPKGVKGTDIPIGARILSVVDCYDALTSDRPYRPAMTEEEALGVLMSRRGTMYDPLIVDTFAKVHKTLATSNDEPILSEDALRQISRASAPPPRPARVPLATIPGDAPDDLRAMVSLSRVMEGDVTLADAGVLAGVYLRTIVPEATCVFYLLDNATGHIVARHVTGTHAAAIHGLKIPMGQRLSGWVAAQRHAILNSDPALDLYDRGVTFGSTLSIPLLDEERVVGVLSVYAEERNAFTQHQQRVLQMFAPYLTQILSSATDAETRALQTGRKVASRGVERGDLRMVFSRDRRPGTPAGDTCDVSTERVSDETNDSDPEV